MTIKKAADGMYHPTSEAEIIELVKKAREEKLELRCRGSAHSVSCAIYTDPMDPLSNKVNEEKPPVTDNINMMLDQYRKVELVDKKKRIVSVEAGCNLGIDPFDPTGTSTWENSLLQQLADNWGWTVSNLGGIDFQTVGGFMSTGSSGGSITHSIHDNLYGMRLVDGRGDVYEVTKDDEDSDAFYATGVAMGLFGVVSKIYFQCVPVYNISGQEASTGVGDASMQMFEVDKNDPRPSLETFLREVEYTRLMWWPQRNIDRVVTWQAQRMAPTAGFRPCPYQEFSNFPNVGEPVCSIFFIVMGNYENLDAVKPQLDRSFGALQAGLAEFFGGYPLVKWVSKPLAWAISGLIKLLIHGGVALAGHRVRTWALSAFSWFINTFQGLDSNKKGMSKGCPQSFRDVGWKGLPMDNAASDDLMPTEFTEIWIPVGRTEQVMCLLRDFFKEPETLEEAFKRTGDYAIELYGSKPNPFWMSMAYSDGKDEWKDGVIRLDIFWFEFNPGNPAKRFFPRFWKLLREHDIPNRLHWGKYHPLLGDDDPEGWVDYYRAQYPHWDGWQAMRAERDPDGVFLNDYWRRHLAIE